MVVDALDLCYTKGHVDTFVILSGDSDFSPLVSKLRENAKTVIGVGVKESTSDLFINNCDEFIYYDDLVRREPSKSRRRSAAAKPSAAPAGASTTGASPTGVSASDAAPAESAAAENRGPDLSDALELIVENLGGAGRTGRQRTDLGFDDQTSHQAPPSGLQRTRLSDSSRSMTCWPTVRSAACSPCARTKSPAVTRCEWSINTLSAGNETTALAVPICPDAPAMNGLATSVAVA